MLPLTLLTVLCAGPETWRDAKVGTRFQVFVPPNNLSGTRFSSITITAQAGTSAQPVVVNLVDDAADGDSDDTQTNVQLVKGESLVRYLKDGTVNDDGGGKWDGDYFLIDATQPVSVSFTTDSDWQHDWAPADNGLLRGSRFFLYTTGTSVSNRDVDVFAYEDGTRVELYEVTLTPLAASTSGIARIGPRAATPLLQADLNEGEDSMRRFGLGRDLLASGRTYELVATKPVTVMFGALDSVVPQNQARDGSGYVPGRNGTAQDDLFYFTVPHNPGITSEQEIRIVAADEGVQVNLSGFSTTTQTWVPINTWQLPLLGHVDVVGPTLETFRVQATGGRVNVFEANWMETGSPGTSDESDFVPGRFNPDGTATWLPYLCPPGAQTNTTVKGTYTHLYLFSFGGAANVTVRDVDADGGILNRTVSIPAQGYADVAIDTTTWSALNSNGRRPYVRIDGPGHLAVNMSNWNDNWMAYATSVLPLNPVVTLDAPQTVTTGQLATYSGEITNVGNTTLTDAVVRVSLGRELEFVSGSLNDAGPSQVVAFDGGTEVRFAVPTLTADETLSLDVTATVRATSAGAVLPLDVTVTASNGAVSTGSSASAPSVVENPAVATITGLTVVPGPVVQLTWLANADVGHVGSLTVQRASAVAGPWTTLSGSTQSLIGQGVDVPGSSTDPTLVAGSNAYYRLSVVGTGGAAAMVGPVLAQPRDVTPPPVPTLSAVHGDRAATLTVGGSSVADLSGYIIERSRSGLGSWTALQANPVAGPTVNDTNLVNGVPYYYRAVAVDLSGNRSAHSTIVSIVCAAASTRTTDQILAWEDMLGAGQNDWDYNDFIVRTAVTETLTSGALTSVQIDYEPLARGAGYVHEFRQALPTTGAWTAVVTRYAAGAPTTVVSTNTVSGTGSLDVQIFADTRIALPGVVGTFTNTAKTQATFVAGQTARLVVTLGEVQPTADALPGGAPWDAYLRLPYLPGQNEIHRASYGGATERSEDGPLAGRTLDFVEEWSTASTPQWSFEGAPMWNAFGAYAPWHQLRRAEDRDWPTRPTPNATFRR